MAVSKLEARIQARKAELDKAKAVLSDSDRTEIEQREQLALIDAEVEEEKRKARDLDLARRLDAARERLGETSKVRAIAIEGFEDTFVIVYDPKAHGKWTEDVSKAATKNESRAKANRDYAVAVVCDWNGHVRSDDDPEFTTKLAKYLTENPGLVTPINNVAGELAGLYASERKS